MITKEKIGEFKVPTGFTINQVEVLNWFKFINVSTESTPLKDIVQKFRVELENKDININGTKDTSENSEIVKFTVEQLSTKPPYSKDSEKWQRVT